MICAVVAFVFVFVIPLILLHRDNQKITRHYEQEIQQHLTRLRKIK